MLITITYTGQNTTDLGYLLHKNPYRPQAFEWNHGKAYIFYPEVSSERTTAALLLDIDPVDLTRGKAGAAVGGLFEYVNDRPYVCSSFMSTAIARVFGTAMTGRSDSRQALSDSPLDLAATVTMLPCRGDQEKLRHIFEPLGYAVDYETFALDENFPAWGASAHVNLTISGRVRLRDLLNHLYVLLPVFDRKKHYWTGEEEVEKLLRHAEGWLPNHPEKSYITERYFHRSRPLARMALQRLAAAIAIDGEVLDAEGDAQQQARAETADRQPNLNAKRLESVVDALKQCGARRVIDFGCGEGKLLALLVRERQFTDIAGVDVSSVALARAADRLHLQRAGDSMRKRVRLFQGALTYKDARFSGYDAACVIEVVEHLDIPRLAAFERVLFEYAKPPVVVLTTPNREYNAQYAFLHEGELRHGDHRFEWTRSEFRAWANRTAEKFSYAVLFSEIGNGDEAYGAPTQMGVFTLCA